MVVGTCGGVRVGGGIPPPTLTPPHVPTTISLLRWMIVSLCLFSIQAEKFAQESKEWQSRATEWKARHDTMEVRSIT